MIKELKQKILKKISPYREKYVNPNSSKEQDIGVCNQKPEVISLIIKSEETVPLQITISFNGIEQTESGKRCEYIINDKTTITVERNGEIESIHSFNLLARLFLDR